MLKLGPAGIFVGVDAVLQNDSATPLNEQASIRDLPGRRFMIFVSSVRGAFSSVDRKT